VFFIELRVGLARSAIQTALLLNGVAAIAVLMFMAALATAPADHVPSADLWLFTRAILIFGIGVFLAGATFVNA
jgi:uncharacterized membrane protein